VKRRHFPTFGIKWHQMASNGIKRHQTASNGIKWHQMASNSITDAKVGIGEAKLASVKPNWHR
jgi:hypothetical protein